MSENRTILELRVPFLDAHTFQAVEEPFQAYVERLKERTLILVDMAHVQYVSSAIAIFMTAQREDFPHRIACMRVNDNVREVFEMLQWDKIHILLRDTECPFCVGEIDYGTYTCSRCGEFERLRIEVEGFPVEKAGPA